LPGAPAFSGDLPAVLDAARRDAAALAEGGVDAVMVENFHDAPFFKDQLPPETVAGLTRGALAVRAEIGALPLGINALRNDGVAALGIAVAVQARFIRVNVLTGAAVTDQGLIEGCAATLLRRRAALDPGIAILADVQVKHAAPLAPQDPAQAARDTAFRGRADALIVSGSGTGQPTSPAAVAALRSAVPQLPILVGSGVTASTALSYGADALIVGTALKGEDGVVCARRVAALMSALQ
jgi:uncharacterized protein